MNEIKGLRKKVYEGAREKKLVITDIVLDRIEYELNIIDELKFTEYFLIYVNIIKVCNIEGLLRSYGRVLPVVL